MILQVFDGHGGKHAADFACYHLPRFIFEDDCFPMEIERVIASAFAQTDTAFAEACTLDADLASGTTALAAFIIGRFGLKRFLIAPIYHICLLLFLQFFLKLATLEIRGGKFTPLLL